MLDLKKCEVIVAIAETQNLTKAAENLGYTQPGISNIVRSIEEETGFAMFFRHRNGMSLTPEAKRLLPKIQTVLAGFKSIEQTVDSINGIEEGHINIGSYSSMSMRYLTSWIEGFSKLYPNISFSIMEGGYSELEHALDTFTIDLALISRQKWHKYNWIPLLDDPVFAVFPADTHFPEEVVKFEDLNNKPLIYHEKGSDPDVENIISVLKANDVQPIFQYCISYDRTIMSMIEHHLGVGILPELVTSYYNGNLKCLSFDPPQTRHLGIATHEALPHSPVVRLFIDYCVAHL